MARVTVVVPTYLRPHFLAESLAALQAQTLADFEVLVCDNGADASTEQVVRDLQDERFVYTPRPENLGMLRNAMAGFAAASAPLVMKVDDDDLLVPDALARLVPPLEEHPEVKLSFGGVLLVDEHGEPLTDLTARTDRESGRADFAEGRLPHGTRVVARGGVQVAGAVLRADVVDWGRVPEDTATAYDLYLALAASERGRSLWFTPEPVVRYRIHPGSDTARHLAAQASAASLVLERAITSGRHDPATLPDLRRRLGRVCLEAGRALRHQGETPAARAMLRRAMRRAPSRRAAKALVASYLPARVAARLRRNPAIKASSTPASSASAPRSTTPPGS